MLTKPSCPTCGSELGGAQAVQRCATCGGLWIIGESAVRAPEVQAAEIRRPVPRWVMRAAIAFQLVVGSGLILRTLGVFVPLILMLRPHPPPIVIWVALGLLVGPLLLVCSAIALAWGWRRRHVAAAIGIVGSLSTWIISAVWFDAARQFAKSQGKGLPLFLRVLHVVMAVSVVAGCILYRGARDSADPRTARDAVTPPR